VISSIKWIIIACTISIACAFCLASAVENNARLAAADLVLQHRNDVVRQFADEREAMKEYVGKAVDRRASHLPNSILDTLH